MATGSGLGGALGSATNTIKGLFGENSTGQQLLIWGVFMQLLGAALGPAVSDITQAVNTLDPVIPLSPEQLATLVRRKFMSQDDAAGEAAKSGIGPGRFNELVELAGSPPSLGLVIAAYQRGIIGDGAADSGGLSLQAAIASLGIEDQWAGVVKALAVDIPTAQDVMQAWLEGQIDPAEALTRYTAAGGDPTWFQTDYNRQGQAPTPVQALEMLNRGLIPLDGTGPDSISWRQAFLEGPWRNKWSAPFLGLRNYISPPRTTTAMLREGSIDSARALQLFQDSGLDQQTAAEYLGAASHHATAAQKVLSMTQIVELYESHLVEHGEALTHLEALGYTAADANMLLSLADVKTAAASLKQATTRLRSLYLGGNNTADQTRTALVALGVTAANAGQLIAVWDLERIANVRVLTEAQIAGAQFYGVITQAEATAQLESLGYSAKDAWIILSVRSHEALPDEPGA